MGKTGGGRGTNGHQIKGRSTSGPGRQRPEADIELPALPPSPSLVPKKLELLRDDIEALLDELDEAMTDLGIDGSIDLVGGAALALAYYERAGTTDVDGALYPSAEIIALANEIGSRRGLRSGWLNNAAQGFIPPGDTGDDPQVIRQGSSLTVRVVGARTLLAMKLRAVRPKDLDDIALLLRECDVRSLDDAVAVLDEMYDGEHGLSEVDQQIVCELLGTYTIIQADGEPIVFEAMAPVEPTVCGKWVFRLDRRCTRAPNHPGGCG